MTDHPFSRRASASGIIFVLLLFGALFAPGPPPRASDSAASIAAALADDRGVILGGMWVAGLALIFAIWFFAVVGTWLAKAGGEADRSLAWASATAGVTAVVLILVGLLLFYGAAYKVAGEGQLALVRALTDAGNASIEMSKFGVALFIAATSLMGLRLSLLPRPLVAFGFASAAIALASSVPLFAEGSFTEFGGGLDLLGAAPAILWILGLSAWMTRASGR